MGLFGSTGQTEEEEMNDKLKANVDFGGPTDTRYCTDILCSGLLFAMWFSMTVIGCNAIVNGDYRLVLHPLDYDGNICGTDVRTRNSNKVKSNIVNYTDKSFNFNMDVINDLANKLKNPNYGGNNSTNNITVLSNKDNTAVISDAGDGGEEGRDMTDYPFLLFVNNIGGGVCVKECPKLQNVTANGLTDMNTLITYGGIFQPNNGQSSELSSDFVKIANYSDSEDALFCTEESCYLTNATLSASASWNSIGINHGRGYAYYVADTKPILSYCLVTADALSAIKTNVGAGVNTPMDFALNAYQFQKTLTSDLWTAREYILCFGLGISFAVSMLYLLLLRLPLLLNFVIWGSMLATIGMFGFLGYYSIEMASQYQMNQEELSIDTPFNTESTSFLSNEDTVRSLNIAGYVSYGVAAILFVFMICLRKSIQLAIGCVKEAGRAVQTMPALFLVPILQVLGFAIFVVIWSIYIVYLASMGHINVTEIPVSINTNAEIAIRTFVLDDDSEYQGWFLLFCFYWTSNFVIAVGHMVIAMSVARWYFSTNKNTMIGCGTVTVFKSFMVTLFYHTGTCAYGALTIAVCQLIRSILARLQKNAKDSGSMIAQCILSCLQCCMWCLEKILKFISKNAYIQCAIFGSNFCTSARKSFFLVARNLARISSLSFVASAVLIIGKLFISTLTTALAYYYIVEDVSGVLPSNLPRLEDEPPMHLYNISGPLVLIFFMSYCVSDMFMSVYDMAMYTVLHCFIADEEMHDEPRYAENGLKSLINKHSD